MQNKPPYQSYYSEGISIRKGINEETYLNLCKAFRNKVLKDPALKDCDIVALIAAKLTEH